MHRITTACVAAALLAGCATKPAHETWQRGGADAAQVARDDKECAYEAEKANQPGPTPRNEGAAFAEGINEGLRGLKLQTMCMEARGYVARVQ